MSAICLAFFVMPTGTSVAAETLATLSVSYADNLCSAVSGQYLETDPSKGTVYVYQTMIYAGAEVDAKTDNPEIIRAKIQRFWNAHWRDLRCDTINFTIANGNVLKLAVEKNSNNFVNYMLRKWQVDINVIDPADNETVLDYIDRELEIAKFENSSSRQIVLQNKQNLILKFGGKRAREINQGLMHLR